MSLKKYSNLIFINFLILIFSLILIEIFLGYWLKDENFGIYMRKERKINWQTSSSFYGKKYDFFYKRNFWGFRGEEFKPENIKIVFEGGSTGNQRYTPEELTIVGLLNDKLKSLNQKIRIYNASTDGKSVNGYINDLRFWFPKIKNFEPKFIIFYIGINDRFIHDRYLDYKISEKKIDQFKDYIKNNSFFVDRFKIIKNKYFPKNTLTYNFDNKSLYKNFQFINYEEALSLHKKNSDKDFTLKKNFRSKLIKLKKLINEYDIQPIFITQVMFDGLKDKELFIINNELKDFAKKNNYFLIPLDEMVSMGKNDFYDEVHTTPQGSNKIANQIYSKLSIFLEKNYEINK